MAFLVLVIILAVLIILIPWDPGHGSFLQTGRPPDWTGFGPDSDYPAATHVGIVLPARNLWDWMQLIIVPASVAILVAWFNRRDKLLETRQHAEDQRREDRQHADNQRREDHQRIEDQEREERQRIEDQEREKRQRIEDQEREKRQHEEDQNREKRQGQEIALERYLERMAKLQWKLITHLKQLESAAFDVTQKDSTLTVIRDLGRSYTITTLPQLSPRGKRTLMEYLQNCELITVSSVDYLPHVRLSGADLRTAQLNEIDLSKAILYGADLRGANLYGADLRGADLREAILSETAYVSGATLSKAEANLFSADLRGANLTGAYVTDDQLKLVKSLAGATMQNGTPYKGVPPVG